MDFLPRFQPVILGLLLVAGYFAARLGDRWFRRIERWGTALAKKEGAVVVGIGLAAIVLRVALLPVMPVPLPATHDEFSFLLAADTFAHGRLANPPHAMWLFLETFHVLQHPMYASMYPPAQGAALAVGQLLGNPWIGVLLSTAAMCAAVTWALGGWLPARWALLGGVLVLLRIGLVSYWMNSYWGGAVAAMGGALVIGALPRIMRRPRVREALLMGIGAGILANSRPLEGFIFCLPVTGALLIWLFSKRSPGPAVAGTRVFLPSAGVLALALAFVACYNRRVTGDALLFPEMLDQKVYTNFPLFLWQAPKPPLHYSNPQFEKFYNVVNPNLYSRSVKISVLRKTQELWKFFVQVPLSIPLLAFPCMLTDKRIRFLLIQCVGCGLGLLAVVWFYPHYAAPLTATIFVLLMQGMRHLRRWQVQGRPVGVYFSRLVVLLALVRTGVLTAGVIRNPLVEMGMDRARVARQLEATPGRHLVLVKYSEDHHSDNEWVYNAADVDEAKVVWARKIPGKDMSPLLDYFRDRETWEVEVDAQPPELEGHRDPAALGCDPSP